MVLSSKKALGFYAVLLRGVNVGGNHKLPMKDFALLLKTVGCAKVATYIQSGNAVFEAPEDLALKIPELLVKSMRKKFGFQVPVIVRSGKQLRKVAVQNPFLKAGMPPETLHIGFLEETPSKAQWECLDPHWSLPDEFKAGDGVVYLFCPKGLGKTKLTNQYFDSKLKVASTFRNWNTFSKLIEMTGGTD